MQALLDAWFSLWQWVFQPAIGVLMLGAVSLTSQKPDQKSAPFECLQMWRSCASNSFCEGKCSNHYLRARSLFQEQQGGSQKSQWKVVETHGAGLKSSPVARLRTSILAA